MAEPDPDANTLVSHQIRCRVEDGRLNEADAVLLREALGLVAYKSAGRYRPDGTRDTKRYRPLKRPVSDETPSVTRVTDRDPLGRWKGTQGQQGPDSANVHHEEQT
jgi:hypothetical protein